MKNFRLLTFVFLFLSVGLLAQTPVKIELGGDSSPRLIQFDTKLKSARVTDANQVFRKFLGLGENDALKSLRTESDHLGFSQTNYEQYFKGVKVEHGQYRTHSKDGVLYGINGEFKKIEAGLSVIPKLTEKQALEKALAYVGAKKYIWEDANEELWAKENEKAGTFYPKGQLVIVENVLDTVKGKELKLTLAYKFNIYAVEPLSRAYVYVDASSGKVVNIDQIIKNAAADGTVATRYSGTKTIKTDLYNSSYRLRDYTRGDGIIVYNLRNGTSYSNAVDFTDANNNWTATEYHTTAKDDAALESAWAFQVIYDYWKNVHGRNSFDNNGAIAKAYVHYSSAYDNAYWDGSVFTFGDGSGTDFDALTSLDVSAHEYGHAICENTANLTYSYESGALNEGLSDIWGAAIEYYGAPTKKIWVMGDDIERRSGHDGLRVLSNPKAEDLPDTYKGTNWYTGFSDYGGVHTNGGPITYWFYLISVGGSGTNDNGKSYNIQALGIDKAEKIVWRTESVYLTNSSTYSDIRIYAIQAAIDLYGAGSTEVIQVTNAFAAIGVGDDYVIDNQPPSVPANLTASNVTSTAVTLSWTASTDSIGVTGYEVYQNDTLKTFVTTTTATISGLTANTTYSYYVKAKDAAGNVSGKSTSVTITTQSVQITYPTSKGNSARYEWIDLVSLGSIDNSTASNNGYGDFTGFSTNIASGSTYTISYSAGFSSSSYTEYWAIWIDFNHDGDFTDTGEKIVSRSSSSSSTLSSSFTVPSGAVTGVTRLRVSMKYNSAQTSSETFSYGEVEDYTVNITDSSSISEFSFTPATINNSNIEEQEPVKLLYPNPTKDNVTIHLPENGNYTVAIYNLNGRLVKSIKSNGLSNINVEDLDNGVYTIRINDGKEVRIEKLIKQ